MYFKYILVYLYFTRFIIMLGPCYYVGSSWDFSTASYLILPWDGDTASGKLGVEIIVCLVQVDTLNGGELLNVQNIFTVDRPGLWN